MESLNPFNNDRKSDYGELADINETPQLLVDDLSQTIGTLSSMPSKFCNIKTSEMGTTVVSKGDIHPFKKLEDIALNNENFDKRCQSIRYMCAIPYKDSISIITDCCKKILGDSTIDIYDRWIFFSNNDGMFKLNDHVVYNLHKFWFQNINCPFELKILNCRYILTNHHRTDDHFYDALDYILDIANDSHESQRSRAEAADVLITCGEPDEIKFGYQILDSLDSHGIYENSENAHKIDYRDIIRALQKRYKSNIINLDIIFDLCKNIQHETLQKYVMRLMTDPTKYDTITLHDIARFILSFILESQYKDALIKRLEEEIIESIDTCSTGYITRLLNIIQGFEDSEELRLKIPIEEEIRAIYYSKINKSLEELNVNTRDLILNELSNGNMRPLTDFMFYYGPEEEMWEDYKSIISEEKWDKIIKEIRNAYIGNQV